MTTQTGGPDWFHAPDGEPVPGPVGPSGPAAPEGFTQVLHEGPGRPPADADTAAEADSPDLTWDDDLLEDWTPQRRTNRLTTLLAVAVVAACMFTAGAIVQKQFGGTTSAAEATRSGSTRGQGFGAGGFPSGGFGGGGFGGGFGGQQGGGGTAAGQGQASGGQAGSGATGGTAGAGQAAAVPAVVGTVKSVKGTDLVVENFAGKQVTVHVPATATVTTPGLAPVAAGMTVSVVGRAAADGSVTASAVVARKV